ncbi:MAG: hypothetical protein H8D92_01180 [Pelagibacteraceae bacterium]|nr:hypothetical protein [Pelagibacteraceae bacterium]
MDERIEKEKITYSAEMAGWGDDNLKEKSMITWIKDRVKEVSTWSGVSLIVVGLLWIFAGSLFTWVAYLAIAWGIFSMIKKQG